MLVQKSRNGCPRDGVKFPSIPRGRMSSCQVWYWVEKIPVLEVGEGGTALGLNIQTQGVWGGSSLLCLGACFPYVCIYRPREQRNTLRRESPHRRSVRSVLGAPVASALAPHSWALPELLCLRNHIQLTLESRKLLTQEPDFCRSPCPPPLICYRHRELRPGESRGS